jgi:hypothetical protein
MPLSSSAEVLLPRTEAAGVADAMIEASRTNQNIPLGQLRMAFQSALDRLHSFLAKRNTLLIHLAAQLHDRMDAFPRHTLGPFQHGLDINQLRPIPV